MSNQKKSNSLSFLFLISIVLYVLVSLLLGYTKDVIEVPAWVALILSELLILVPAIVYVLVHNINLGGELGFAKIKVSTGLMTVILSFTVMPIVGFVNILTQFFVSNTMTQASDTLFGESYILVLFLSSIYGPLCEEFMFRGVLYKEYSTIATPMKAALISGLFFGLMHLNVNQACYAFVLGFIFAIVNRASGSIITSVIMHITINLWNVALLMLANVFVKITGETTSIAEAAETARTTDMLFVYAGIYLVLAIIFGAISVPIVVFIAKNEGRMDKLKEMFSKKNKSDDLEQEEEIKEAAGTSTKIFLTASAIIAIVISLFVMLGLEPLLTAIGWQ